MKRYKVDEFGFVEELDVARETESQVVLTNGRRLQKSSRHATVVEDAAAELRRYAADKRARAQYLLEEAEKLEKLASEY